MTVRRNIIANYAGQVLASLFSLALVPVYIGYLGIEAYAVVGLFAVIQAWMALLDLGMTPTLGREMARFSAGAVPASFIRNLLRSLETVYLGIALAVGVALTLGAGLLTRHWLRVETLPMADVADALSLLGIVVASRFCEGLYRSGLMGLQQQVWVNGMGTVSAFTRSFGAWAVLAFVSPSLRAFFLWQGLVSAATLLVLAVRLWRCLPGGGERPRFSRRALIDVRRFAGGVFGITLLNVLLTQVDKLLLSRLLPLSEFGHFMLASTISGALYMVGGPIILALMPVLVRLSEGGHRAALAASYHRAAQLVSVLLAPPALLLILLAEPVLFAWSGDRVLAAATAPVLRLIAIGTFISAFLQLPIHLQVASGWTSLMLRVNCIAVLLLVPALLLLVPGGGPVVAAGIWAALNLGYLVAIIIPTHRRLLPGELGAWARHDVAQPMAGALLVLVPLALAAPWLTLGRWEWLALLVTAGLAAAAAGLACAPQMRGETVKAVTAIWHRRRLATAGEGRPAE